VLISADWELFKTVVPVREQTSIRSISEDSLSTCTHVIGLEANSILAIAIPVKEKTSTRTVFRE
jgi:hypothetical protein